MDPHGTSAQTDELTRRVSAIHPALAWHFGPGEASRHRLTVSAGGVAEVRPTAERWLRGAPPADATWEYRSSQQADPDALSNVLEIGGQRLDLAATRFRADVVDDDLRVHVGVHHPAFAGLPDAVRGQITYLVLDWLLGEDDVERWLGHVEALDSAPHPALTGGDLVAAVRHVARQQDPDAWTLMQWNDERGTPGIASFRRALRWIDHPTLDTHHAVQATFAARDNGLPADGASLDGLREIEDELGSVLGTRGILVGHETHEGVRTFHAYADGEDQNIREALSDWAGTRRLRAESHLDPAWTQVRRFTG